MDRSESHGGQVSVVEILLHPGPVWTRLIVPHGKLRPTETQSPKFGEMAQSVKCLLFKPEPEFDLQNLCERLGTVAHACSVGAERQREELPSIASDSYVCLTTSGQ